jgi:hypothetical protein
MEKPTVKIMPREKIKMNKANNQESVIPTAAAIIKKTANIGLAPHFIKSVARIALRIFGRSSGSGGTGRSNICVAKITSSFLKWQITLSCPSLTRLAGRGTLK